MHPLDGSVQLAAPAAVRLVDLDEPLDDLVLADRPAEHAYRSLLAVGRLAGNPVAVATFSVGPDGRVAGRRLAYGLTRWLDLESQARSASEHLAEVVPLHSHPRAGSVPLPAEPLVSVVIPTCSRPEALAACLRSVLDSDYENFEVIVVENRPYSSATARMLATRFSDETRISYVEELPPGAARARNAGLARAEGELVAFADDDIVVDPRWMRASVEAMLCAHDVACVAGLILPLELESDSQLLMEQFASFGKGFQRKLFRLPDSQRENPLFPYTPGAIGSGASTMMRTRVARELGGFDIVLGPGTPASGGEDLEIFLRVLRAGYAVAYEPGAMVWHRHPDGMRRLRRQVYDYGVGLGALLAKQVIAGPDRRGFVRAVPAGVRYLRDPESRKNAGKPADYPRLLTWLERLGLLVGPFAYACSAVLAGLRRLADTNGDMPMPIERTLKPLTVAGGEVVSLTWFDKSTGLPISDELDRERHRAPAHPGRLAAVAGLCTAAALSVALGLPGVVRLPIVLAFLCLAPGVALLTALRARLEAGLVLGASLAVTTVVAQSMLWLNAWSPAPVLYLVAVLCWLQVVAVLRASRRWREPDERAPRRQAGRSAATPCAPPGDPPAVRPGLAAVRTRVALAIGLAFLARATGARTMAGRARIARWARALPRPVLVHLAVMSLALLSWSVALAGTSLAELGGAGLLDALPALYFVAVALVLVGFATAAASERARPWVLGAYVLTLIVVLHGTTAVLYAEPRYSWVYKHLGVINLIASSGHADRDIDIYNNWPAFFAANAWLSRTTGVAPIAYAGFAQLFFNAVDVLAIRFALRGLTGSERTVWTAALLFELSNWLGQDYLAPQAFAFVLSLIVLGLCLRCAPSPVRTRSRLTRSLVATCQRLASRGLPPRTEPDEMPGAPLRPRGALVVGAVCFLAVVISHQLSPVLLIVEVTLMAVVTQRVPIWVTGTMSVVEIWWVWLAWPFVSRHFALIEFESSDAAAAPGRSLAHALPGAPISFYAPVLVMAAISVLAGIGLARRLAAGKRDFVPAALIGAPVLGVALQSYGGEGPYRAYLFALPWLAFLGAQACMRGLSGLSRPRIAAWRLAPAAAALAAALLFAYFGQEIANHIPADAVDAATWYERHAPAGSVQVDLASNAPNRLTARYPAVSLSDPASLLENPRFVGHRLGARDVPNLEAIGRAQRHPTYFTLTVSQEDYARLNGLLPAGSVRSLVAALERSREFRLVFRRPTAWIFRYQGGAPSAATGVS